MRISDLTAAPSLGLLHFIEKAVRILQVLAASLDVLSLASLVNAVSIPSPHTHNKRER